MKKNENNDFVKSNITKILNSRAKENITLLITTSIITSIFYLLTNQSPIAEEFGWLLMLSGMILIVFSVSLMQVMKEKEYRNEKTDFLFFALFFYFIFVFIQLLVNAPNVM